jgi:hypothetical protein
MILAILFIGSKNQSDCGVLDAELAKFISIQTETGEAPSPRVRAAQVISRESILHQLYTM